MTRDEKIRIVLLSLVNECEECAMRGERIMCQTAPKEEMRLKCVEQTLDQINKIIKQLL